MRGRVMMILASAVLAGSLVATDAQARGGGVEDTAVAALAEATWAAASAEVTWAVSVEAISVALAGAT